jgi:serine/threonine protein kinase/tetratricopeptide (TPR) repeat protein
MDSKDINRICSEATQMTEPTEREAYLDRSCGDDQELRRRVRLLLDARLKAQESLDSLAGSITAEEIKISECPGTVIGPYKLLEQIGEGGFGVVFLAEQARPVRRRLALKVLKPGMDTRQVIARFEAERQALAIMDHPNIAKVFDGGATTSGRPYFVMELVNPGAPAITTYCDQKHLTLSERLELFLPVCKAVQHAHQKGIIHRDLKPSNVLVMVQDNNPVIKVIDFGVAKALGQELTDKTLFTSMTQMIGTPLYMSPEQAGQSSHDIDTRSDIYSLGVMLYELLTGTTPFDKKRFKKAPHDEICRVIREEEPPKPSTRLSELGSRSTPCAAAEGSRSVSDTSSLESISALRRTEPAKLTKLMRGELDWIVMKCLEKDRNRRYDTANGLARDIEHFLRNEPVQACPPSAGYRLRKFLSRNREAVLAAALLLATLLAGIVATGWQAVRATQAQEEAIAERDAKDRALQAKQNALQAEQQARHDAETTREEAEKNFQRARRAVEDYFTLVSESTLLDVPGLQSLRQELLEAAIRYYREFIAEKHTVPELQVDLAASYLRLSQVYSQADRQDEAMIAIGQAIDLVSNLVQQKRPVSDFPKRLAGVFHGGERRLHRGAPFSGMPVTPESIAVFQNAERLWEQFARDDPEVLEFQTDLATIHDYLGELHRTVGNNAESLDHCEKSREICLKVVDAAPSRAEYQAELSRAYYNVGQRYLQLRRFQEAEDSFQKGLRVQENLAAANPDVAYYQGMLANLQLFLGDVLAATSRPAPAEASYRRGLDIFEQLRTAYPTMPAYREGAASAMLRLGAVLRSVGELGQASDLLRRAWPIYEQLLIEFPARVFYRGRFVTARDRLVSLLNAAGQPDEAETIYQQYIAIYEKLAAAFPGAREYRDYLASGWSDAGRFHFQRGEWDKTVACYSQVVELGKATAEVWNRRGVAYHRLGQHDKAVDDTSQAIALNPGDVYARSCRGNAYAELGDWAQASVDFGRATDLNAIDPQIWYHHALVRLQLRDTEGFRSTCARMVAHFPQTNLTAMYWIAWACALAPDALADSARPVPLAELAWATDPSDYRKLITLGAVLYRAGRFQEAARWLAEAEYACNESQTPRDESAYAWLFQAMNYHRLGQTEQALQKLDQALQEPDRPSPQESEKPSAGTWTRRLSLQQLRHEAEELVKNEQTPR